MQYVCVCLCVRGVIHCIWGPACRQMVLIYPAPPAYSSEGSLAEGKRRDQCGEKGGKVGRAPWQEAPTSAAESYLCSLSRPRRPQSRQRRNRRCRFSSWRSRSGTGARGRLTGALQGEREKVRIGGKGYERVGGMGNDFWFGKLLFDFPLVLALSVSTAPLSYGKKFQVFITSLKMPLAKFLWFTSRKYSKNDVTMFMFLCVKIKKLCLKS